VVSAATAAERRAPGPAELRRHVEAWTGAHQQTILGEYFDLLAIPNVAADTINIRRNAVFLRDALARRGFEAAVVPTNANPLVLGERRVRGAKRTLLLYCQYDGQPVHPPAWNQADPFVPVLRDGKLADGAHIIGGARARVQFDPDWRVYARAAADAKGPIIALFAALDALAAANLTPTSNLRVVMDGDEERGSPQLVPAIARYRDRLQADLLLVLDGPSHFDGRPTLVFGARGILTMQLTVYGPKVGVHSGNYGNWVPNPALRLAHLLASMKDDAGHVLVRGFATEVPPMPPAERALLDAAAQGESQLLSAFGIAAPERPELSLQEALQFPTLNVRGLQSAFIGPQARTIIPDRAVAELDVRLVKETPADSLVKFLAAHVHAQGYHLVNGDPDDAARAAHERIARLERGGAAMPAFRTDANTPLSRQVIATLTATWNEPPVCIRNAGGTVPIAPFIAALECPAILVPIVNYDNNQHEENENLRLGHLFRGIVTYAALLRM
jgi:acetylornithine deacetylase/succinyl-diaminopimelate desuccinylase-like protein